MINKIRNKDITKYIFDKDTDKLNTFSGKNFNKVELTDGYDIINDHHNYDLILLDPYADFIPNYKKYLPKIFDKAKSSSILLFILNLCNSTGHYNKFRTALKECLGFSQTAIIGRILAHPFNEPESKYHYEIYFFYHKIIFHKL